MREVSSRRFVASQTPLSFRENEILGWLAVGKSGLDISIILGISVCTVRIHIQGIKRKLDATNIPHAVSLAFNAGLLSDPHTGSVSNRQIGEGSITETI